MKNLWQTASCLLCLLPIGVTAQAQSTNTQNAGSTTSTSSAATNTAAAGTAASGTTANPSASPVRHSRHVYTNDDLEIYARERMAVTPPADTVTTAAAANPTQPANGADEIAAADAKKKELTESLNKQAEDIKKQIALLERESDVNQREMKLRQANYYGDAGTQLRNGQKFEEDAKKNQEDLQKKQQELNDAKQKLENLREQARRAGVRLAE